MCYILIVNAIRNFIFGLAEAAVYGFCKSRKQKFVMLFTIHTILYDPIFSRSTVYTSSRNRRGRDHWDRPWPPRA